MEPFRLVCRTPLGEWYMHDTEAENARGAFERAAGSGLSPFVVVPERLGRGVENTVVQRWKMGGTEHGDCLNCGYELKGLIRAADGLAICPECGVGAVMKPGAVEAESTPPFAPGFRPGATLDAWGITFSIVGFVFFPLAILGIVLGAFAYEYSRGIRGVWAMRLGVAALVVGFLLFLGGVIRY